MDAARRAGVPHSASTRLAPTMQALQLAWRWRHFVVPHGHRDLPANDALDIEAYPTRLAVGADGDEVGLCSGMSHPSATNEEQWVRKGNDARARGPIVRRKVDGSSPQEVGWYREAWIKPTSDQLGVSIGGYGLFASCEPLREVNAEFPRSASLFDGECERQRRVPRWKAEGRGNAPLTSDLDAAISLLHETRRPRLPSPLRASGSACSCRLRLSFDTNRQRQPEA